MNRLCPRSPWSFCLFGPHSAGRPANGLPLAAGLAVFWLWPWVLSDGSGREAACWGLGPTASLWVRLCFFLFLGLFLVGLAMAFRTRGLCVPRRWASGLVATGLVLSGAVTLVFPQFVGLPQGWLVLLATVRSLLGGAAVAVLCVECGSVAGVCGARTTMRAAVAATVGSAACCYVLRLLPSVISQLALVVLGVASLPVMMALVRQKDEGDEARGPIDRVRGVRVPWKLTITTVVWTATYGAVSAVFDGGAAKDGGWLIAYVVGALALLGFLLLKRLNFNDLIYKVGFLVAASGVAAVLFAHELLPGGYFLFAAGCRFVELLVWGLFANLVGTRGLSAYWTTSLNVGIWTLGRLAGFVLASCVLGVGAPDMSYSVALAAELVILVAALFLSSRSNFAEGWGMERAAGDRPSGRQIDHCCSVLRTRHGLTQREVEVLRLLAKGATRSEVSDRLCISSETAKTHARHIYQKLGVGSRDAAVQVVDAMIDAEREF